MPDPSPYERARLVSIHCDCATTPRAAIQSEIAAQIHEAEKAAADKARAQAVEECAALCEAVRCRDWSAQECARQIRDHEKNGRLMRHG